MHEGEAAAQLERSLGGNLERVQPVQGQKNPDFQFIDGPNAGKKVDFMWTENDPTRVAKMNEFFEKNAQRNQKQLMEHLDKADIVPLDYRNLTPANQNLVDSWIKNLTPEQQSQIIILR